MDVQMDAGLSIVIRAGIVGDRTLYAFSAAKSGAQNLWFLKTQKNPFFETL